MKEEKEQAARDIVEAELFREAIEIEQRGKVLKIPIGRLRTSVIELADDRGGSNMVILRKYIKEKTYNYVDMRNISSELHPDKHFGDPSFTKKFQEFNNANSILKKYFEVITYVKAMKEQNTPVNISGLLNIEITVDRKGYNSNVTEQIKDKLSMKLIKLINKTPYT